MAVGLARRAPAPLGGIEGKPPALTDGGNGNCKERDDDEDRNRKQGRAVEDGRPEARTKGQGATGQAVREEGSLTILLIVQGGRDAAPSTLAQDPTRQYKVIRLVLADPPPTPSCFDSRAIWQEYLLSLHFAGERLTRRKDVSKRVGKARVERTVTTVFVDIDYCQDCAIGGPFQLRMVMESRCMLHKRKALAASLAELGIVGGTDR